MSNSLKISAVALAVLGTIAATGASAQEFSSGSHDDVKLENQSGNAAAVIKGDVTFNGASIKNNENSANYNGAGVFVESGSLTVKNGTFEGNNSSTAASSGGAITSTSNSAVKINLEGDNKFVRNYAAYSGGAIFNGAKTSVAPAEKSVLTIEGTALFQENSAQNGGAVSNKGVANLNGETTFTKNTASGNAGAFENSETGEAVFGGKAVFSENGAKYDGGAVFNIGSLTFNGGARFEGNTAGRNGGAIYNAAKGKDNAANKVVFSNGDYVFSGNTAAGEANDIYNIGGKIEVSNAGSVVLNGGIISKDYVDASNAENNSESLLLVSGEHSNISLNGASDVERMKLENQAVAMIGADTTIGSLTGDSTTLMSVDEGAKLTVTGDSSVGTIVLGSTNSTASLEIGSNFHASELQVDGDSKLYVANDKSEIKFDRVSETMGGKFSIQGSSAVNDAHNGDLSALAGQITVVDGSLANSTIGYEEGTVVGAVTGTINEKGEVVAVKEEVNKNNASVLNKLDKSQKVLVSVVNNDLRKRLGDVRSGGSGVWARISGAEVSGDNSFESDVKLVQIGADTTVEGTNMRVGGAFSYGKADSDDKFGSADFNAYSLAGYGVWMNDAGQFVDVVARYTNFDTDLVDRGQKASLSNNALSLSGEFGWRFDLSKSVFVEPSVELAYTHIDGDSYALGTTKYNYGSVNSLQGRAGFMAGLKCPNDFGNVYVRAALVHEFDGDAEMKASAAGTSRIVKSEGKDTWVEYAVGASFNVAKTSQVYVDLERTSGSVIDEDWRANVGVRYNF